MTLLSLILIPLLTAAAIAFASARASRTLALFGTLAAFAWSVVVAAAFDFGNTGADQFAAAWNWIPTLGLRLSLGADSVSLLLVLLTTLIMPLAVLGSFTAIRDREKEYFFWLLILEAAMIGVFLARDLIVFYTCFEFTLLPMYFLIAVYGSANRARAATVFFLYTFTGSMITLAGLVYVAWWNWRLTGGWTFDIASLTASAIEMSYGQQSIVLLALCCGFAVKVPLFPVHTWLPLAHTEAPTAGSVVLAAVLLKLGTYGLYRFALPMCPVAITEWSPVLAILCIIGIVYGALICWVQRDVKKLVAYSSVSHLGFCVLGLVALNSIGVSGSIAYMINHGLSTGALFFLIGMVYERYHTRSIDELGGLARRMPVWTFFMVFFIMSSVALPGLNGFIGEFLALVGAFVSGGASDGELLPGRLGPWYAAVAGTGMILAAIYLLYLAGHVLFGPLRLPAPDAHGHHHHGAPLPRDLSGREITVLAPLAVLCVVLGVKPGLILDPIETPVNDLTTDIFVEARAAGVYDDRVAEREPDLNEAFAARREGGDR
ncbi:MAG: NuoM family protein [Phycisphaerales bacterium]